MPLVLNNIPSEHFNTNVLSHHFTDFYILNEKSRKILANLFDCLGNISSYNDYYAFFRKFKGFGEFKKCKISQKLKTKLKNNQGLVVYIDFDTNEIDVPCIGMERWFINNYSRVFNKPISSFYTITSTPISYNNVPFDYTQYKNELINNTNFYPLSEDEMTMVPIYNINRFDMSRITKNKITITFNPDETIKHFSDDESTQSDNSDDVKIYLRNKSITISNPQQEPVREEQKPVEEEQDRVEEEQERVEEEQERVEEEQDRVEEEQDRVEEEQEPVEERQENRSGYNLAKEIMEKHNNNQSENISTTQAGYTSRFWGLFGWR